MIVRATAHPTYLPNPPLPRAWPGLAPLLTAAPKPVPAASSGTDAFRADFSDARWIALDDTADAAELGFEAAAADASLLRCVACVAFATLVLAVVSSLPLA
ncbi:MAG: hypothetical protein ACK57B_05890 [Betaproteobacteria bacterium]|jgi:hypothetical protein